MGYNTTVIVMNDALGSIETDPEFGKRLAEAIREVWGSQGRPIDVPAYGLRIMHGTAAIVVESHHADREVLVKVGGNTGVVVKKGK